MKAAGVREIAGDVIVDDRLFSPAPSTGSGPRTVSPIVINDNVIDVFVRPATKVGEPAAVTFQPATRFVAMDADVATGSSGVAPIVEVRPVGSRHFAVRGQIPLGHAPIVKIYEVDEPASFAPPLDRSDASAQRPCRSIAPGRECTRESAGKIRGRRTPAGERIYLASPQRIPPRDLESEPQLAREHVTASTGGASWRKQFASRSQARGRDLKSARNRTWLGLLWRWSGRRGTDLVTPRATVTLLPRDGLAPDFFAYDAALPILGRDGTLAKAVGKESPVRGHAMPRLERTTSRTTWTEKLFSAAKRSPDI